jgi:hypothetical protein
VVSSVNHATSASNFGESHICDNISTLNREFQFARFLRAERNCLRFVDRVIRPVFLELIELRSEFRSVLSFFHACFETKDRIPNLGTLSG